VPPRVPECSGAHGGAAKCACRSKSACSRPTMAQHGSTLCCCLPTCVHSEGSTVLVHRERCARHNHGMPGVVRVGGGGRTREEDMIGRWRRVFVAAVWKAATPVRNVASRHVADDARHAFSPCGNAKRERRQQRREGSSGRHRGWRRLATPRRPARTPLTPPNAAPLLAYAARAGMRA